METVEDWITFDIGTYCLYWSLSNHWRWYVLIQFLVLPLLTTASFLGDIRNTLLAWHLLSTKMMSLSWQWTSPGMEEDMNSTQGVIRGRHESYVAECCLEEYKAWMEEGDAREAKVVNDEADNGVWGQIKLCIFEVKRAERRMMLKLRGGTVAFQIEMGRWHGLKREERVCKECYSGEVEDVCH